MYTQIRREMQVPIMVALTASSEEKQIPPSAWGSESSFKNHQI
jgi:hypothetical protein